MAKAFHLKMILGLRSIMLWALLMIAGLAHAQTTTTAGGSGSFCPIGSAAVPGSYYVVSASVSPSTGGNPSNLNGAVGEPLPEGATDGGNGTVSGTTFFQSLIYDLTGDPDIIVPEGTVIDVSFANHFGSNPTGNILSSLDGVTYTALGSSAGPWTNNTFRYDEYTVPANGIRFLEVDYGGGGGLRFDGVAYDTQCQLGPAPPNEIIAVAESFPSIDGAAGGVTPSVLASDTINGVVLDLNDVTITSTTSSAPDVTLDTNTGLITVAANTAAGIYTVDYEICEIANPANCASITETVTVTASGGGGGFCPAGATSIPGTYHVVSASVSPSTGGNPSNLNGAVGEPLPEGATDGGNGTVSGTTFFQSLIYDLTGDPDIIVPEGTVIDVSFANHFGSNPTGNISSSLDGVSYTALGSSAGPWTNNTFRYDEYTVPSGGARFIEVDYNGGGGLRFDGAIYQSQCQPGSAPVTLAANKTVSVYDPQDLGLYALPGNDVIYTISVENTGTGNVDSESLILIDSMPSEVIFYNDDIDDAGPETTPVAFQGAGSGLTFDNNTDVGYSDSSAAPTSFADCTYVPASGYDPNVNFICINPTGSMSGGSTWSVSFRARIE